jgi:hypothetical protein
MKPRLRRAILRQVAVIRVPRVIREDLHGNPGSAEFDLLAAYWTFPINRLYT